MTARSSATAVKLTILDLQPIDPPVGGGRARLLGLYHGLGETLSATYVGSYDWRGPRYRRHKLSPSLEEIDVPLPDIVFAAHDRWRERAGALTVIDVLFPLLASRADDFVHTAADHASAADIVAFSHPWVYPLVRDALDPGRQLIVYDSQNVEGVIRGQMFDGSPLGTEITRYVAITESQLLDVADVVLACSETDRGLFAAVYDTDPSKILVAPNGVFVSHGARSKASEEAKAATSLVGPVCVFVGSAYGPNIDGARFIRDTLAPALPSVTFAICGNVCDELRGHDPMSPNVRLLGVIDERTKRDVFAASDAAVNPIFAGSGTNLKMFDFFAAGLPTVTTPHGARGITEGAGSAFIVCDTAAIATELDALMSDPRRLALVGAEARALAERSFSWEKISPWLGERLLEALAVKRTAPAVRGPHAAAPRVEKAKIAALIGGEQDLPAVAEVDALLADLLPYHDLETASVRALSSDDVGTTLGLVDAAVVLGGSDPALMNETGRCECPIVIAGSPDAVDRGANVHVVGDADPATLAIGVANVLAVQFRRR